MNTIAVQQADLHEPPGSKAGRWSRWFIFSSVCILLFTGMAKIFSAFGKQGMLDIKDPIFNVYFRYVMLATGLLELIVSGICLLTTKRNLSLGLITWMATNFLLYRLALWFVGWHRPCPCMGNFYDAIHVPAIIADYVNKSMLAYLLVGSCWFFICPKVFKSLRVAIK